MADPRPDLLCFNGLGGFNAESEYEIRLEGEQLPPTPWTNVIANPSAGFMSSESGFGEPGR
jgi:Cellobiose phosphorylase